MKPAAIEAHHLSVRFGSQTILNDLSFSIPEGSVTAVIGPNGSGKTTLLRTLLGLYQPSAGHVTVLGGTPEVMRQRVGYVPQQFAFDRTFPMTVSEFLYFSQPWCSETEVLKRLSQLDIAHAMNDRLSSLSGGQLQRVLIARALLRNPSVLYLDEPAAGIDITGEKTFYDLITQITADSKTTIVIVSHELDVVYRHATQVLCVNTSLCCHGIPQDVLTSSVLQQLYGKETAVYRHHDHHTHTHD